MYVSLASNTSVTVCQITDNREFVQHLAHPDNEENIKSGHLSRESFGDRCPSGGQVTQKTFLCYDQKASNAESVSMAWRRHGDMGFPIAGPAQQPFWEKEVRIGKSTPHDNMFLWIFPHENETKMSFGWMFSPVAAPDVVILLTFGAGTDENFMKMTFLI